jgi:hypothetical protein
MSAFSTFHSAVDYRERLVRLSSTLTANRYWQPPGQYADGDRIGSDEAGIATGMQDNMGGGIGGWGKCVFDVKATGMTCHWAALQTT